MRIGMRIGMRQSRWLIGIAMPLLLLGSGGDPKPATDDGMTLHFRDSKLQTVAVQESAEYATTKTGESGKLERSFPDAPPQIPHTVENMFPITLDENECADCHEPENAIGKKDVPMPKSHFKRAIMGAGAADSPLLWEVKGYEEVDEVGGARYNCNMCHTPRAENVRVIESTFERVGGPPTP